MRGRVMRAGTRTRGRDVPAQNRRAVHRARPKARAMKCRTRKTDAKRRASIVLLYSTGWWTMRGLADLFNISSGRVSQIVNDNYNEAGRVAHDLNP